MKNIFTPNLIQRQSADTRGAVARIFGGHFAPNLKLHLFSAMLLFSMLLGAGGVYGQITVCASGCDHTTIQAAIDAAVAGDVIEVQAGTYDEVLLVNKPITILGPNDDISAVNGTRVPEARLLQRINIDETDDVTISGFEFFEVPATSTWTIYIYGNSNNFAFENNRFVNCQKDAIRSGISSSTGNITVTGNLIQGISNTLASGILLGGIYGTSVIADNKIDLENDGYSGIQTPSATGLTISGNDISNTTNQGIQLAGTCGDVVIENNLVSNTNTISGADKGAIRLYGTDFTGTITITGNILTNSYNGIAVKDGEDITGKNIVIENNDLSGNSNKTIYNGAAAGILSTTCNWFGSDIYSTVEASIQGDVEFVPYLTSGTDDDPMAIGFQPEAGSCGGGPVRVYSDATETVLLSAHATIQAGIDAAVSGNAVRVDAGTYSGGNIVDKSLTLRGDGCANTIIDGNGTALNGISVNNGVTNVTIESITVRNTNGGSNDAGIRAFPNCDNLSIQNVCIENTPGRGGIYVDGPVDGVLIDNCEVSGSSVDGRGIVLWNGLKENITITNNNVHDIGGCCGIELQDGNASAVNMSGNTVTNVGDSGMSAVGLNGDTGPNLIDDNTITNTGRFGLEIKNPNGATTVSNNIISLTNPIGAEARDLAGIAVMRRGVLAGNVDVPTGVAVTGNTVSGYVQPSDSDGFGIVIGGTNHTVTGNIVTGNDVGIQQQAGHAPYPGDGDQNNIADDYFGRDNSPIVCGNNVSGNTLSNTLDTRNVGVGGGLVTNTNTGDVFCSIQDAIDDPATMAGHIITVAAGTYAENVVINKSLTLNGANEDIACGSRVAESLVAPAAGLPVSITTDGVTLNGFEISAPSSTNAVSISSNRSNVSVVFNNIHDIGTTVTNANVHAIVHTVANASSTSNITISDNCFDNISSSDLTGYSASAIGILQSTTTGDLTGLNIERNTINDVTVNTGDWPTGKIAYGIQINVGGNSSFQTNGKVVNAIIRNNEISNLSGFISTGIGLEGNTEDAVVENNIISAISGRKLADRSGGGYDLSGLKFENNRYVSTVTVQNNSFQTNTFVHDGTPNLGYAISNYVTVADGGEASINCNWLGTATLSEIEDNPSLTGKIFNKDNCVTNFVPYLVNGNDNDPAIGFQPEVGSCSGGPVRVYEDVTEAILLSIHTTIQAGIDAAVSGNVVRVDASTYPGNVNINKSLTLRGPNSGTSGCETRLAEAVIQGSFTIGTDGITVDGFEFTGANAQIASTSGVTVRSNITIVNNFLHATTAQIPIRHGLGLGGGIGSANWTVSNNKIEDIQLNAATAIALFNIDNAVVQNNCINHTNVSFTGRRGINADGLQTADISGNTLDLGDAYPAGLTNTPWGIQISMSDRDATGITMTGNTISNTYYGVVGLSQRNLTGLNATCNILTGVARGFTFNSGSTVPQISMPLMEDITIENNDISSSDRSVFFRNLHSAHANGPVQYNNLTVESNKLIRTTAGAAIDTDGSTINDGLVMAEMNWYGSALYSEVLARNVGPIDFVPYQVNDTDLDLLTSCFEPDPLASLGGPVQVYNGTTLISGHPLIQEAIDAVTTLDGYIIRIASGTYTEDVDAVTGGKSLIFAPGASPGCVTINGNFTLNAGDVLEMEIEGTTSCTEYDQFIVNGDLDITGASLVVPAFFTPMVTDEFTIFDVSGSRIGFFDEGTFVVSGSTTYYVNYNVPGSSDIVLTKCCSGLLDLGIFHASTPTPPIGNKLDIKVRPINDVINGAYSSGIFTIRTLTANNVTFTNEGSPYGFSEIDVTTDATYTYYTYYFETGIPYTVDWDKDTEYTVLTLGYACIGDAVFELTNASPTPNTLYYQELNAVEATGIFYAPSFTSPSSVTIAAGSNSPVCETMSIQLEAVASNGSPAYTYAWTGPNSFSSGDQDPVIDPSSLASAGTYTVTVTDMNGCTGTTTTEVLIPLAGTCVENTNTMLLYPTITQAINAVATMNGHTLEVPAGNWPEMVNVTKDLTINGANAGTPCDGTRATESVINAGLGTAVNILSDGVTLDGFQIEGSTGVSSTGFDNIAILNNIILANILGVGTSDMNTSGNPYTIQGNCIELSQQTYEVFDFSPLAPLTLTPTQTPGAWYTDRYAPAGFAVEPFDGDFRLKHSINAADCESCRPGGFNSAFYNTQGRKYDIDGTTAMSIDLYVPSSWATTDSRMAGFWGTMVDASNVITMYPILEFTSDDNDPRFRGWDNGVWIDMGLPAGFTYDSWYTLTIKLEGSVVRYYVDDLSASVPAFGSTDLTNVILQGHNTPAPGVTYDIYWDNLLLLDNPAANPNSPTTGIAVANATGAAAVTLENNSVSDAFYGYVLAGVDTDTRTVVREGAYTGLMQGVVVSNTLNGVSYVPSLVGVEDLEMLDFAGDHPTFSGSNFHSGIYVFTGGADPAATVDILVDNVTVSNTGNISPNSSGVHFADFSTGAGNRLTAVVNESTVSNNLNRGVYARGENAVTSVTNSEILGNGGNPHGTGGNNGYGVIANNGTSITLTNNYIENPATQVGYTVTAIFNGVAPASTILATENHLNRNGNGDLTSNAYAIANFTATCNWWGSDDIDVVDGLVSNNVLFIPYLNDDTDTDLVLKGFQPDPMTCVQPTRWYVNDNAATGDVFTTGLGNNSNPGTKSRPLLTIGAAVSLVDGLMTGASPDTIFIDAGGYDEQVIVPNTTTNLHLIGVGSCDDPMAITTTIDFTGTVSGKPTLLDVAGDGSVIDGIHFNVDLSTLNSAIIASDAGLDIISVVNNCIDPYHTVPLTNFGSYGNRNAISINYGGSTNFRVAAGGVDNILLDNNRVTASVVGPILGDGDDIAFRSAVSVDEGAGTYTRNTFQSINHDVLVRFNSNGNVVIGGSPANANTFLGGGVQYSDPNAAGGTVEISHNSFDGEFTGSVLRLQNNYHDAAVTVSDNSFTNLRWGISLENFNSVTVEDNDFTPLAGFSSFRHITVNTKSISSNSNSIVQVPINGSILNNQFNVNAAPGGTALAFYNHDSNDAVLGTFTVEGNTFPEGFSWAVYLGDQLGSTIDPAALALFPEYNLGAGSDTDMACWDQDIDIQNNLFDVGLGSGLQTPPTMNNAERNALEVILWHLPDNACLGELIYFLPVEVMAKVLLQGPYDTAADLMKDDLRAAGLIPVLQPHSSINVLFPGSFTSVNNFVTEVVNPTVFDATGNNAIVDWVWLELRDMNNHETVLATRSALVQRDGDIVDLDGSSAVLFPDTYTGEYFLMVRHRNHLGAMTAAPVDFSAMTPPVVDFASTSLTTFGTTATSARRLIDTNTYGLWAGNTIPFAGSNFEVKYNGLSNDRLPILNFVGASTPLNVVSNVYARQDVNMDGQVKYTGSNNDRIIILNNVGAASPLIIITQEPNN